MWKRHLFSKLRERLPTSNSLLCLQSAAFQLAVAGELKHRCFTNRPPNQYLNILWQVVTGASALALRPNAGSRALDVPLDDAPDEEDAKPDGGGRAGVAGGARSGGAARFVRAMQCCN